MSVSHTITFKDVCFTKNDRPILQKISGTFAAKRITTLVGPSGAGKTTLLKLCNGLLTATAGDIVIGTQSISTILPTTLRQKVGMALQAAPMINGTVYDNLCLPKKLHNDNLSEQGALRFLEDVHLPASLLHQQARDLSGGQRQRVSIARTLVNAPPILLLDEITSALDHTASLEIEQLITQLNTKYGVTIIWITHNLEQALHVGHDTWVMIDGQLIEAGPSSLLENPQQHATKQFLAGGIR